MKVVLALQHGEIPPHLHLEHPNPYIPWDDFPIVVPTQRQDWPARRGPRTAGLSSFGFSGTNAHLVLEQAPESHAVPPREDRPEHVLVLSAKNPQALTELAERYHDQLEHEKHFSDVCYTAATGRAHFSHRLAVLCSKYGACPEATACRCRGKTCCRSGAPESRKSVTWKACFPVHWAGFSSM